MWNHVAKSVNMFPYIEPFNALRSGVSDTEINGVRANYYSPANDILPSCAAATPAVNPSTSTPNCSRPRRGICLSSHGITSRRQEPGFLLCASLSETTPIELLDYQCRQIHAFKATDIDCRHWLPGRGDAFAKRMNTAGRAKTVLDDVLVERVSAHLFRWRAQCQRLLWNEPHQNAFPLAHGAIARYDFRNFALNLEGNLAAMATSLVFHLALLRFTGVEHSAE